MRFPLFYNILEGFNLGAIDLRNILDCMYILLVGCIFVNEFCIIVILIHPNGFSLESPFYLLLA
jgi:hypothetical protein